MLFPSTMYFNTTIMITIALLIGVIVIALLVYCWRRHFAHSYNIEGITQDPRQHIVVRVVIASQNSNKQNPEGLSSVKPQYIKPKCNNMMQDPLWSKIDLGPRHPPVFVDLNSLECV